MLRADVCTRTLDKHAREIDTCLNDAACAKGQGSALACQYSPEFSRASEVHPSKGFAITTAHMGVNEPSKKMFDELDLKHGGKDTEHDEQVKDN